MRKYGWVKDRPDERDLCYAKAQPHYSFPASVDLRDNMPPIWDQGQLGSCTSFGIARSLQYAQNKAGLPSFEPSHLFIYYNERWEEGTISQDSGAAIRDGIKSCNVYGFAPESLWPYDINKFTEKPPQTAYDAATKDRIHFYASIDNSNINNVKLALVHQYPVVFGFTVYQNFEDYQAGQVLTLPTNLDPLGGHCTCIAGYDDGKNAFLVANSWGTSWGDGGYFWISYDYIANTEACSDFWVIRLK